MINKNKAMPCSTWDEISNLALENGLMDELDLALIRALVQRISQPDDLALKVTLACLLSVLKTGGLRIPNAGSGLENRLCQFLANLSIEPDSDLGCDPALNGNLLTETFTRNRIACAYAKIMGTPGDFLPLIIAGSGLYFQKHYQAESSLSTKLAERVKAPDRVLQDIAYRHVLDTVLDQFPLCLSTKSWVRPMSFDTLQKAALTLAMKKRLTLISGGPGTGKTSLTTNVLRVWVRLWLAKAGSVLRPTTDTNPGANSEFSFPRIRLAAPTGRAAQRMAESIQTSIQSIQYSASDSHDLDEEKKIDQFVAQISCETLHALLRYNPGTGEYFYHNARPLPADLVIIDEVSMVDVFGLTRVMEALEDEACLILIGDGDQLPSVDSGAILADLIPRQEDVDHPLYPNIALLTQSHRSQAGILDLANKINIQAADSALASLLPATPFPTEAEIHLQTMDLEKTQSIFAHTGCKLFHPSPFLKSSQLLQPPLQLHQLHQLHQSTQPLIPIANASDPLDFKVGWPGGLQSWLGEHYLKHSQYSEWIAEVGQFRSAEDSRLQSALAPIFVHLDQARILTFTRKSWHGCIPINAQIRAKLQPIWDPKTTPAGTGGFHGSPILILENDYNKGLFNGDVGVFLRLQGRPMGFFRRGDSYLAFPAPFLPRHETAFAMTIHKSQGSEYDHVLLVLPESGNRLLFKETLYTAITRARTSVAIYGANSVFKEAIGRKVNRESGLTESLKFTNSNFPLPKLSSDG